MHSYIIHINISLLKKDFSSLISCSEIDRPELSENRYPMTCYLTQVIGKSERLTSVFMTFFSVFR